MAIDEKPDVVVPSDQAPSYQLEIEDIVVGDGDEAVPGRVVEVHYVGVSWNTGQQFDASWDRGSTFRFALGKGKVIAGWDQGVAGMSVGGRRRITIRLCSRTASVALAGRSDRTRPSSSSWT